MKRSDKWLSQQPNTWRYLLQDNQDFVNLNQEIEHVEDYLSIQKLRYGEIFTYLCEISLM
ncbi:MAG: sensor histidine kinase [Hungatella sp.]|uniref:sensor histidine kinase n=1 Tax=Hungatella sp. TaxID=2613924 RepID=UPI0039945844